jgi:hypothetical protein
MSWKARRFDLIAENNRKPYREATSQHHRKPRSLGGGNEERNISELPRSRHAAWHIIAFNWCPERIAEEINRRYLDPDFAFVAVPIEMLIDVQKLIGGS